MNIINTYQNPNDTPEQRAARVQALVGGIITDLFRHPEKNPSAMLYVVTAPNGQQHYQSYDKTQRYKMLPDGVKSYVGDDGQTYCRWHFERLKKADQLAMGYTEGELV